ncbi:D-2-hydroxyacid dehydrogenase [archaeon]|nr:D-2-hydroxyacid dehydrogenase [archaeon]MBL7056982.1 D-2-hydroxyacid dehydrogenase [Candidatus Woesearchaeota archaeon]
MTEELKIVYGEKEYCNSLKKEDFQGAEALVLRLFENYEKGFFDNTNLKYIGTTHTDVSHFNLEEMNRNKITLTNVPGYSTEVVAELTISALLNISRRTHDAMNFVKQGNWGFESFMGWELKGKTLGVIGLGNIGRRIAEIALGLGMKVVHFSRSEKDGFKLVTLDELLKTSDVISLNCALNKNTEQILNKEKLSLIKKGTVLLNPGRSELVDLDTVFKLCEEKCLSAWFEAIEEQEIRNNFGKLDNIYLTPHFGWMTLEAQNNLREITLKNIQTFLNGNVQNKVN